MDDGHAHVAIFDAAGHDLQAGLLTSIALAATRNARRGGADLLVTARLVDKVVAGHRPGDRMVFATAFLARLDLATGVLEHINTGHPGPVVLRGGRVTRALDEPGCAPLGLGHVASAPVVVRREQLQPGDRVLFYSDGFPEARSPRGGQFGAERLVDLTERHEVSGLSAPETLRRVMRAVLEHQEGELQDDATLVLPEWTTTGQFNLLPDL